MEEYRIEEITAYDEMEQLGTKEKFWFYDNENIQKLFKIGRPGTGEDWSEKIAYELAVLLDMPCAKYELAIWDEKQGTVSTSFVPNGARLVHGNELLVKFYDKEYPKSEKYHLTDYKLSTILNLIDNELTSVGLATRNKDKEISKPIDIFIGYLIFDTWISNQDRHHENWGIIEDENCVYFAQTYDHAAGLGSKVSAKEAKERLTTKDTNRTVEKFVTRAKTPFYSDDDKKMTTISVVKMLLEKYPKEACYWINKIENISDKSIQEILDKVPSTFMENISKEFVMTLLKENKTRLVKLKKEVCNEV